MMTNTNTAEIAATLAVATEAQLAAILADLSTKIGVSFAQSDLNNDAMLAIGAEIVRRRDLRNACELAAFRKSRRAV
jgi:hypothetical protein